MPTDEAGVRSVVEKLSMGGKRSVVLTGFSSTPELTGAMCYDAATGKTEILQVPRVHREFYGTGDVFSSVLTGALLRGKTLAEATAQAVEFILECARLTAANDLPLREGVDFEPLLGLLTEKRS
jgi:pyridoxine kinase